jgi:predicted ribosomally synthesized peptide with SipW-like signal peptide
MVIAVVIGLMFGSALALFSDTETSQDNAFGAGSINLVVDSEDPLTSRHFDVTALKPTDTGTATVNLENTGLAVGDVYIAIVDVNNDENGHTQQEIDASDTTATTGELQDFLELTIEFDSDNDGSYETSVASGTLTAISNVSYSVGTIAGTQARNILITYLLPDDPSVNQVQTDLCDFDIQFTLE